MTEFVAFLIISVMADDVARLGVQLVYEIEKLSAV